MSNSTRLNNISLLRIVAITTVLIYHFLSRLTVTGGTTNFPGTIGVQIFLFISGYLHASKEIVDYKQFYKKQLHKLLLPAILFVILAIASTGIYCLITNINFVDAMRSTLPNGVRSYSLVHLWFIPVILLCYAMIPLLKNLDNNKYCKKSIKYLIISLILVLELVLSLHRLIQMVFASFLFGFLFKKYQTNKDIQYTNDENKQNTFKLITIGICLTTLALCAIAYYYINPIDLPMILWIPKNYFLKLCTALMGCAFCIIFIYTFEFTNRYVWLTKLLDKQIIYTYSFYITHHFFIVGFASTLLFITNIKAINYIIVIAISTLTAVLLYWSCIWINRGIHRAYIKHKQKNQL